MARRQAQRDDPAIALTDDPRFGQTEPAGDRGDILGQLPVGQRGTAEGRSAMAAAVDGDQPMIRGQQGRQGRELLAAPEAAMQQQDRRAIGLARLGDEQRGIPRDHGFALVEKHASLR